MSVIFDAILGKLRKKDSGGGGGGGGEITISDVTGLSSALSGKIATSAKGAANGVASLDSSAKVPAGQIPDLSSAYVAVDQKGAANGVPSLDSSAKIPRSQVDYTQPITTIPAATSAYTLSDGVFEHVPNAATTYTLPNVTDTTITHWASVTVSFANALSVAFENASGTTLVPLDTITVSANDIVEYLCRYDALQSKWVIACGKLNA